ncbi:TOBE domain-containing protein [Billgrantia tianxiuensis]|uniref:TOBE domain-containing protein n=2 Tax=Halomonadaceae TaxID=28256 RepID=UPI0030EC7211
MSDRIAVFNDGVVQQLAPPEALYEAPENAFVANFIGENNRLFGEVTETIGDKCQVRLDSGETVLAKAVAAGGIGARTTLSLRPERVDIVSNGAEEAFDNRFRAEVREVIYLGDHLRTRVSVCGNDEFILKTPNAKGYASLRPGQSVEIGWSSDDCRALDA